MSKSKTKHLSILLVLSLIFAVFGFINTENTYAASKKIHLKKTTVKLVAGKTYQQKLLDKKGKTIKATKVKWKSKKKSVAKINKKGKITAIKAGTAKMTAKYKGKTYSFKVTVKKPSNKYDMGDTLDLLEYLGNAVDYSTDMNDAVEAWSYDGYDKNSYCIDYIIADATNISKWAKKAKAITKSKPTRYCKTPQASERDFITWDGMIDILIKESNSIKNADVYSMSDYERMSFAGKVLDLVLDVNSAYIEVYDYPKY